MTVNLRILARHALKLICTLVLLILISGTSSGMISGGSRQFIAIAKIEKSRVLNPKLASRMLTQDSIHYGKYGCYRKVWNGPESNPEFIDVQQGFFELLRNGTYRWLENGPVGEFSYDPITKRINWLSGYFKSKAPQSTIFKLDSDGPQILIYFTDSSHWICK